MMRMTKIAKIDHEKPGKETDQKYNKSNGFKDLNSGLSKRSKAFLPFTN